jgi:hypothetical protein
LGAPPTPSYLRRDVEQIPGAVSYGVRGAHDDRVVGAIEPPTRRPSGLNIYGIGLIALLGTVVLLLIIPQWRARALENRAKPLVSALAGKPASIHCPRYLTAVVMQVGSVSMDSSGKLSSQTQLTGPICDGLRTILNKGNLGQFACLTTTGDCSFAARRAIIGLIVLDHESQHIRGILNEEGAECASVGNDTHAAQLVGLSATQGRVIAYLHLMALNPSTPEQYRIANCPAADELRATPPSSPAALAHLTAATAATWAKLSS